MSGRTCCAGGGAGDDTLRGGPGNDTLRGNAGDDVLHGGPGNDTLRGNAGDDVLHGGAGADRLFAGAGADRLHGKGGDDMLHGGPGDDAFVYGNAPFGRDTVRDFEDGVDVLDFSGSGLQWRDLQVSSDEDGNAVVRVSGRENSVTLVGVDAALIDRDDFLF